MVLKSPVRALSLKVIPPLVLLFLFLVPFSTFAGDTLPGFYDDTWARPVYEELTLLIDDLAERAANGPGEDASQAALAAEALGRWFEFRQEQSSYIYELLSVMADHADAPAAGLDALTALGDQLGAARQLAQRALALLKPLDWDSHAGQFSALLRVLPALRPELSPSSDFWAMLYQRTGESDLVILAAGSPDITALRGLLAGLPELSTGLLGIDSGLAGRPAPAFFRSPVDDPSALLFRTLYAGELYPSGSEPDETAMLAKLQAIPAAAFMLATLEAEYLHYRITRQRFDARIQELYSENMDSYVQNLQRHENGLQRHLPLSVAPQEMSGYVTGLETDFQGFPSDAYWGLLTLLENPLYITEDSRMRQLEWFQLGLLTLLQERLSSGEQGGQSFSYRLISPSGDGSWLFDGMISQPRGVPRPYVILALDGPGLEDPSAPAVSAEGTSPDEPGVVQDLWASLTLKSGDVPGDPLWSFQTGLYVMRYSRLPASDSDIPGIIRLLNSLLEQYPDDERLAGISDPVAALVMRLRLLELYHHIGDLLLSSGHFLNLDLGVRNYLLLAAHLLECLKAGETPDLALAIEELSILTGVGQDAASADVPGMDAREALRNALSSAVQEDAQ